MLEKTVYKEAFHHDAAALATAARQGLDAPVPSCPGWTVATLVTHLTGIYASRIVLSRAHARENIIKSYDDLGLSPSYRDWFDAALDERPEARNQTLPPMPPDLLDLFVRTAATLEDVLWALEPSEPVWTWFATDRTAGFWQRRMAQETAVHRWDTQLAYGEPAPIDADLASDGIDEVFDVMLPMRRHWAQAWRQGSGETYHFHRTDGPGEWLVRFDPDGPVISREHARGDVALRGSASDLLLWLWHRIPNDRLEVFGDATLVDRFFELVPPG
ncbi:MAG TPA: maleylpyruvate isomerase family mycothiol-dependent enzyme [Chloroflexota bacterium]|nr:maleylpyruvate isomerase family mycothiol-dependent enzyme [Chloroflexota bacterium]